MENIYGAATQKDTGGPDKGILVYMDSFRIRDPVLNLSKATPREIGAAVL